VLCVPFVISASRYVAFPLFFGLPLFVITSDTLFPTVPNEERASMHTTIWEDNVGALTLANLELPQMTPRSKAIGVRYHWFRQYVSRDNGEDGGIVIKKVDTKDQVADIFTKGLGRQLFERLRKMLSGW
jgi:hypothetical protein